MVLFVKCVEVNIMKLEYQLRTATGKHKLHIIYYIRSSAVFWLCTLLLTSLYKQKCGCLYQVIRKVNMTLICLFTVKS